MKPRYMLLAALFLSIFTSVIKADKSTGYDYNKGKQFSRSGKNVSSDNITYERNLQNMPWWIFIQGNNRLINIYLDPDQG